MESATVLEKDAAETQTGSSVDSVDGKTCDNEGDIKEEAELKTKVKGDMVVVGTERISPSSDLSGTGTKGMYSHLE